MTSGISSLVSVSGGGLPQAPVEIADEVEMYAREWGRHGKLRFVPTLFFNHRILRGTWVIDLTLKADDKRLLLWKEQRNGDEPTEQVWLHEPNPEQGKVVPNTYGRLREPMYRALDLHALGASGVRAFLEQGNTWSGRNVVTSPEDELRLGQERRAAGLEQTKQTARVHGAELAEDRRRSILKIPFVGVVKDLISPKSAATEPRKE